MVEIKNGRKKILQQPVDLTNLTVAMAEAAVKFVEKKSSKDGISTILVATYTIRDVVCTIKCARSHI